MMRVPGVTLHTTRSMRQRVGMVKGFWMAMRLLEGEDMVNGDQTLNNRLVKTDAINPLFP